MSRVPSFLSRGVLQTLRAHLPASAVRDTWLRRLREDDSTLREMVGRLSRASPADPAVVEFASDAVGAHVVQVCLERAPPQERSALLAVLAPASEALARTKRGSYVVRKALELSESAAERSSIIEPLLDNCAALARSESGAHVVQSMLVHASKEEREAIVTHLLCGSPDDGERTASEPPGAGSAEGEDASTGFERGSLLRTLAADAHGSLVAQAVLELASTPQRTLAQHALLGRAKELAQSSPGSFVVGTALRCASKDEAQAWLAQLLPHAAELAGSKAGIRALHACAEVSEEADREVAVATGLLANSQLEAAIRSLSALEGAGRGAGGAGHSDGRATDSADGAAAAGPPSAQVVRGEPPILEFPARKLDAHTRRRAHELAKELGLFSESVGEGENRRLIVRSRPPAQPLHPTQAFLRRAGL